MSHQKTATVYFIEKQMMYLQRALGDFHAPYDALTLGQASFEAKKYVLLENIAIIEGCGQSISKACQAILNVEPASKKRTTTPTSTLCNDKRLKY